MLRRLEVHANLVAAVDDPTIPIIFRPPERHNMSYPCVIYDVTAYPGAHANGVTYVQGEEYEITFLSKRPGDSRCLQILQIPNTTHLRTYLSEDIVHDVFRLSHMVAKPSSRRGF